MNKDFKRKKLRLIVISAVCAVWVICIATLLVAVVVLFGSSNRKSSEDKQTQQAKGNIGENSLNEMEIQEASDGGNMELGDVDAKNSAADTEPMANDKVEDSDTVDIHKDKTLSILGDSISTYEGWMPDEYAVFFPMNGEVGDVDETWWKMFMDDTGLQLCANSSSSGSTCVGDSLSIDDPKFACSNYRIDGLIGEGGAYPDVIIVYMGTNDCVTNVPIGENDGTQPVEEGVIENFSDAYTLILDKLETQYPMSQIFCCTLTQLGGWGSGDQPFITFVNSIGLTSEDYSKQIETIVTNRGLNIIDLYNCGITENNMHKYVTDGVHLNPEGMKLVRDATKEAVAASVY